MIFETGQIVGNKLYRIESFIAHGGMAEVWRVTHLPTGQIHALKIMNRKSLRFPDLLQRFDVEYDVVVRLEHPHIVKVYDKGVYHDKDVDLPWFTMAFYPSNLRQRLPQISVGEGLSLLLPVLDALGFAHAHNVCHRDLKPMNILIDSLGRSVLSDFGIAKETDRDRNLTGRNIIGTAYYISPEQCMGLKVTPKSDIYAFGVILYQLATGHFPFEDTSEVNIIRRHISESPRPVHEFNPAISSKLAEAIDRCLKKKPEERFDTAYELSSALKKCDELAEVTHRVLKPGQVILGGKYKVIALIEQGGFAEVYRIKDLVSRNQFAMKICLPALAYDNETIRRFKREINIMKALRHPYIVSVNEEGELPYDSLRLPFFIMPFYPGNLGSAMSQPVDPDKALRVMLDVLDALSNAHKFEGAGILHRDLKPSNILIGGDGHGYLTDFGIAKISKGASSIMTRSATMTRAAVGTSYYMAPEQIKNEEIDARADLYSIGIILYEIVTGRKPFEAGSSEQIIAMHLYEKPDPPSQHNEYIPPRIEAIVLKCLEKDRNARFVSADEVGKALRETRHDGRWFAPEKGLLTRVKRPLRSMKTNLRQWAFSTMPLVMLVGLLIGMGLGLGGAVAARVSKGGGMPTAREVMSPSSLSYVASMLPAARIKSIAEFVQLDADALPASRAAWSDPTETAFLDRDARGRYDQLKALHDHAVQDRDAAVGLRTETRMKRLLAQAKPTLQVREQASTGNVQTNQLTASAEVQLAMAGSGDVQFQYRWDLLDAQTGKSVQSSTADAPTIRLADVPVGSYKFQARGVYRSFETEPVTYPIEIKRVDKPIELQLAGTGEAQQVVFGNFDPAQFRSYEWEITDAAGQKLPAPPESAGAPLKTAGLLDGVYRVRVLAYDVKTDITAPYQSNPQVVTIDRTPPTLVASANQGAADLGAVAGERTFTLLRSDPEITLNLKPADNIAPVADLRIVDADGRDLRANRSQDVIAWNQQKTTYEYFAIDPRGNRSQPFRVRVQSVPRDVETTLMRWKQVQADLQANPAQYARTNLLTPTADLAGVLGADGQLSRDWLERNVANAELVKRLGDTADKLAAAMERDRAFAERAGALRRFAQGLAPAGRDRAIEQLNQAIQTWQTDTAQADLEPKTLLGQVAQHVLPAIDTGDVQIKQDPQDLTYHLTMTAEAGGVPGASYRYVVMTNQPAPNELGTLLDQRSATDKQLDTILPDPTKPVYLVIQTSADAGEPLGSIYGQPQMIPFPAPVVLRPELTAAMDQYATNQRLVSKSERNYPRAKVFLAAIERLPVIDRAGQPAMNWLVQHQSNQTEMQQLQTDADQLRLLVQADELWKKSLDALGEAMSGWAAEHRTTQNDQFRALWAKAGASEQPPDLAQQTRQYAAQHANGLLAAPEVNWQAIELKGSVFTIPRAAFGKSPVSAALELAWIRGDDTRNQTSIRSTFNDQGTLSDAPPRAGERYQLAARWAGSFGTGADAPRVNSAWSRGGEFLVPAGAPSPTPTPAPTPAIAATPTPRPTPTPAPTGEIGEDEAKAMTNRISQAILTLPSDKRKSADIIRDYSALFGSASASPESGFLAPYTAGGRAAQQRDTIDSKYFGFSGARYIKALGGGAFQIEYVSWNYNGERLASPYKVTLGREGSTIVIKKDERIQ